MKELTPDLPVLEKKGEDEDTPGEIILDVRLSTAGPIIDRDGREYDFVDKFLADNDFYQGLNMVTVIRRRSDDKLFGYFWWDDISKHGEPCVEPNGYEFGLECDTDAPGFDWDTDYVSHYVWVPVEPFPITAYKEVDSQ